MHTHARHTCGLRLTVLPMPLNQPTSEKRVLIAVCSYLNQKFMSQHTS